MNRSKSGVRKPAHYGSVASVGGASSNNVGGSGGIQADRDSGNGPLSPAPSVSTVHSMRRERSSYMFGLPNDLGNYSSDQISSARLLLQRLHQQQAGSSGAGVSGSMGSVDARRSTVGSY